MSRTLDDIVNAIGMQAAIELTRAWGGRFLYVPQEMHQDHPIALAIGLHAAAKLSRMYPGEQITVPAERNVLLRLRNARICAEYRPETGDGKSVSELSKEYGIHRKMVQKILDAAGLRNGRNGDEGIE